MDFMSRNFDLPDNIFYFHNVDIDNLEFVLDFDSEDKFYSNLLRRYYAKVLDCPNKHTMVLARPNESTYFHMQIPAFNIKYIEDCFQLKDFPDPTKYLIENSCPVKYTKDDIFDCWFHKKISWSNLLPIKNNISVHDICQNKSPLRNKIISKKTRMPFTNEEDVNIIKYIVTHRLAYKVLGKSMWQMMEHANVCEYRSWQSMKERYLKQIKFNLNLGHLIYPFLSQKIVKDLRQGLKM